MKNLSIKTRILILIVITFLGITSLVFFASKLNGQDYPQLAMATVFAPKEKPPVVELISAQADAESLTFTYSITGLELVTKQDWESAENVICEPYIRSEEGVDLTFSYRERDIPEKIGEPIIVSYIYQMEPSEHQKLHLEMDITLGPCGPFFDESNVSPPLIDLIANYRLSFVVPVDRN